MLRFAEALSSRAPRGNAMDGLNELLPGDQPRSEEERRNIDAAWEHLFARALSGPFDWETARGTLEDVDPRWKDPEPGLLVLLCEESSARLKDLAAQAQTEKGSASGDVVRAAREVQFSVAQLFAASEVPRIVA